MQKGVGDRAFVYRMLPPTLIEKKLKPHRADVLLEREKALLPATQEIAVQHQRCVDAAAECDPLLKKQAELRKELKAVQKVLNPKLRDLSVAKYHLTIAIRQEDMGARTGGATASEPSRRAAQLLCPCPMDNCRGYVFSQDCACQLCKTHLCKRCHRPDGRQQEEAEAAEEAEEGEAHVCKQEDVDTVDHLLKTTRPCPKCHTRSVKVDGCSQVFCIQCQTAWNWNTGEVEHGIIHAPDYFAYMRRVHGTVPRVWQSPGRQPVWWQQQPCWELPPTQPPASHSEGQGGHAVADF
jgi:hypothetical protein